MTDPGTGAAFNERSAAANLVTTGAIYCGVLALALQDPTNPFFTIGLLIGGVVVQVILLIVMNIYFAIVTTSEPNDERDAQIQHRSLRLSHLILTLRAVVAMLLLLAQQAAVQIAANHARSIPDEFLTSPLAIAHALLLTLVASEVVRSASVLLAYRRGV